ncbi:MAG: 3-oxoacyl-ACP reductase FabG [Firmicutes bacterium]|nr:3-oxoacyl-ACP reductase FabG [Bacillota bacterium]
MGKLSGRFALITGASQGIGRAIALEYYKEGACVAIHFRGEENLKDAQSLCAEMEKYEGTPPLLVSGDVSTEEGSKHIVDTVNDSWGKIDIVVNNAGIMTQSLIANMPINMWDETIAVDLRGTFLMNHWIIPGMIQRRWGRIINIASQLGQIGAERLAHYCAAKAGVIGYTKAVAREISQYNVTINCIAPGPINTTFMDVLPEEWKQQKAAELPLGRFGDPWEVSPTAVLLASDPGGNLYTGQTLGPNSGDVML